MSELKEEFADWVGSPVESSEEESIGVSGHIEVFDVELNLFFKFITKGV
jgi:hypothetical protein